jgi:ABC-type transporter Mla subunit MlaD
MGDTEETSILEDLDPRGQEKEAGREAARKGDERSILRDLNHISEHIQTLEEAARVARAVEFEQLRAVVEQLEAVAGAAKAVERDLSQELANTNRLSVSTARLMRDRLAGTLRALAEALVTADRNGPN